MTTLKEFHEMNADGAPRILAVVVVILCIAILCFALIVRGWG